MKYRIVEAYDPDALTEKVNAIIQEGWRPIGGVSVTEDEDRMMFFQAMILASLVR